MKIAAAMVLLAVTGLAGAWLSILIRREQCHPLWLLICTLCSAGVWIFQARDKSMSMAQASILFDVVYGIAYFLGFLLMGEAATWKQVAGLLLALSGLVVSSL